MAKSMWDSDNHNSHKYLIYRRPGGADLLNEPGLKFTVRYPYPNEKGDYTSKHATYEEACQAVRDDMARVKRLWTLKPADASEQAPA